MTSVPEVSPEEIQRAVETLKRGGLIAFPTETVYGLGADADNPDALARIFKVKGRPANHPLIVHIPGRDAMGDWAIDIPDIAFTLAESFWPGPLTLILKRAARVSDVVTGGQHTVGLRCPAHPVAQRLLQEFKGGIAAPSANRYGHVSPTRAEHVREELGDEVDLIIDGGPSEVGIESTIVDVSGERPVVLRPGRISTEALTDLLHQPMGAPDAASPRAPGSHASHYAPRAAMKVVPRREFTDELARHRGQRVAVIALEISVPRVAAAVTRVLPASAALYARELYAKLRELDGLGADLILVEAPPKTASWTAIWDRLNRAVHAHAIGPRAERHSHPWKQDAGKRSAGEPAAAVAGEAASGEAGSGAGVNTRGPDVGPGGGEAPAGEAGRRQAT